VIRSLLFAAIALCFGCRGSSKSELLFVADYSGSTRLARGQQLAVLVSMIEAADPKASFCLFRMGYTTEEIMSGSLDEASEVEIVTKVRKATGLSDDRRGTNFAQMADTLARTVTNSAAERVQIVICTDGDDDFAYDPANAAAYSRAVSSICRDKRIESVRLIGVLPQNRMSVRAKWAEAGTRLSLLEPEQAGQE